MEKILLYYLAFSRQILPFLSVRFYNCLALWVILLGSSILSYGQGEVSVDKFTGSASITIPLYTVQAGGVSLPIALNYRATGVQVSDQGGLVGTNWNLSGDVVIQREVRGLPDDFVSTSTSPRRFGWLARGVSTSNNPNFVQLGTQSCQQEEAEAWTRIQALEGNSATADILDTEPDIFSYTVPGHIGQFVLDGTGVARTMPYDPISISCPITADGITAITIKTPEGNTYLLDVVDYTTKQHTGPATAPRYFQREYKLYKDEITYNTAWHARQLTTRSNEHITFTYQEITIPRTTGSTVRRLYWDTSGPTTPVEEYQATVMTTTHQLTHITSPSTVLSFVFAPSGVENTIRLNRVDILSNLGDQRLIKRYKLSYVNVTPVFSDARKWYDKNGTAIDAHSSSTRAFLKEVRALADCASFPPYTFTYSGLTWQGTSAPRTILPPPACVEQDYWGYYNGNGARTLVPQLYVYPSMSATVPGWPYRLFEIPGSTAVVLSGADRRPATDFSQTLAGTLTEMKLPTGGKVILEYEPHHFFDPVANTTRTGGGVRVSAVRYRDNITGTEQETRYQYLEEGNAGRSSGRLLDAPRFAFTIPSNSSSDPTALWRAATVRADQDLSISQPDQVTIGYGQVSEKVVGRGRSIYTYSLFATSDDASAAAWTRSKVGIARVTNPITGQCPNTGIVNQAGTEIYPFPASTNCDYRRGMLNSIVHKAEPRATGEATVRTETFTYALVLPGTAIQATVFENLFPLSSSSQAYAYATYSLQVGYQYSLVQSQQFTSSPQGEGAVETMATTHGYNAEGRLASIVTKNSDNAHYRTRYKYLSDFSLATQNPGPLLSAMKTRVLTDGILGEPVETINEVIRDGTTKLTAISLQTYQSVQGRSVPFQVRQWQPGQSVVRGTFDSTWVRPSGSTNDLTFDSRLQPVTTVREVDAYLKPSTIFRDDSRQLTANHFGYAGMLPVLQIAQANAREVLFSDFESSKPFEFYINNLNPTSDVAAVRTGKRGVLLTNGPGNAILGTLPESSAPVYRLSFWAKASGTASMEVKIINLFGSVVWQQGVFVADPGKWSLKSLPIDLATILGSTSRSYYRISISSNSTVGIDDVLFLPATASAASVTYDPIFGKTSETNSRDRTTFYEYNNVGEISLIKDHNGSILQKLTSSYGAGAVEGSANFIYTGALTDKSVVSFSAAAVCLGGAQYTWDFGDPSAGATNSASGANVTHVYDTGDMEKDYTVTMRVTTAQGQSFTVIERVHIIRQPLSLDLRIHGVQYVDLCANPVEYRTTTADGTPLPADRATEYRAILADACGGVATYEWQRAEVESVLWTTISSGSSPTLVVPFPGNRRGYRIRCIVRACNKEATTSEATFQYLGSTGCQP